MMNNPFRNTKASYFDDNEIVEYWVELNEELVNTIVEPTSSIPVRILGGKGSGKTHILRFFSFQAQKIRALKKEITPLKYIQKEKYLGIYMSVNGLLLNRFSGHNLTEEDWQKVFYYYINIEFIERFLKKIIELLEEIETCNKKVISFDSLYTNNQHTLKSLFELITKQRKDIDMRVSKISMPFTNTSEIMSGINPIFNIENSFLEIIYTILTSFEELQDIKALFIIDEFENASNKQQRFYNNLLRHPDKEKLKKITIRIAGRLTIENALDTLDDNEKLLEGSEINTIYLEDFYKTNFTEFTKKLYKKRIPSEKDLSLEKSFISSEKCNTKTIDMISEEAKDKEFKRYYLEKFQEYLTSQYKKNEINLILHNIKNKDIFIEKMNTFVCYKAWNKSVNLVEFSTDLYNEIQQQDYSKHKQQEKFISDMIYQLLREYRKKYYIAGYSDIVKVSNYNPRIFLLILSNIFEQCSWNKIDFYADSINCKIQSDSLLEASTWFWNNFTEDVQDNKVLWAVNEICSFFREARQSPKPSEKTMISFSYKTNEVSDEINELVDIAVYHSLLLEDKKHNRKDRNSSELTRQLRIHPMLAPKWELSLSVGGTTKFSTSDMNSLFKNNNEEWKKLKKIKLDRLHPPFKEPKEKPKKEVQPSLFELPEDL